MIVELEIPDPRFAVGDTIRVPNTQNSGAIIYEIVGVDYRGRWDWQGDGKATVRRGDACYVCSLRPGGVWNNADGTPISEKRIAFAREQDEVSVLPIDDTDAKAWKEKEHE